MATNWDYYSQIQTAWCMKLELKNFMTILVREEKYLILVTILLSQNITIIKNVLVLGKMKHEKYHVPIEIFAGLNKKIYSIVVSDSNEYKKTNRWGKKCCC